MPHRLLIVEDESLLARDLACTLEGAGYEIAGIARDMRAALRLAAAGRIDLATMDVRLAQGADGVKTACRLWTEHGIRSLFVSASLDRDIRDRAAPA